MSGEMYGYVRSATVALTAAFGMSACSLLPEQSRTNNLKLPIEVFEVRNAQGTVSKIASIHSDQFDAFMDQRIAKNGGKARYDYGKDEWLKVELAKALNQGGFDPWSSMHIGQKIINTYDPQTYNGNKSPLYLNDKGKGVGPVANFSSAHHPNFTKTPEVSTQCMIAHLTDSHKGETWALAFLMIENAGRGIKLPYEFGDDFAKLARIHEIAHCMGANEQQADKILAKMMLKESTNIDKTLAFLELFKAIRIATVVFNSVPRTYYGSFLSIDDAIQDFKKKGGVPESREEIWSIALERNQLYPIQIGAAASIIKYRRDLITSDDYMGMANLMVDEIIDHAIDDTQKDVLIKMARSFFLLGSYIEGPPRPVSSAPSP